MISTQRHYFFDKPVTIMAAALYAAIGASMFMIEPLFVGALMEHRGFSGIEVGSVAAAELAGNSLAAIVAIFWSQRISWRIAALVGVVVGIVGNVATIYAQDVATVTAVRFFTAFFGLGVIYVISLALISKTQNASRNFAIAIVVQATYAGIALLLLPGFVQNLGVSAVALPMAAFCALGALVVPLMPARELTEKAADVAVEREKSGQEKNPEKVSERWKIFAGLALQALWYLGIGALWAFIEVIGTDAGLEHASIGQALAICTVAGVSGALLASWFGDRAGVAAPFVLPVLLQGVMIWLFLGSSNWIVFLIAALMLQITWNFALPYLLGFIARVDEGRGLVVLIPTAQGLGVALGPILAGAIYDVSGLVLIIGAASVISIASAALFFPLGRALNQGV